MMLFSTCDLNVRFFGTHKQEQPKRDALLYRKARFHCHATLQHLRLSSALLPYMSEKRADGHV
jgi:hypothetical protein